MYLKIADANTVITAPRRSPRFMKNQFDIFVHKVEVGKVSQTAEVIHGVERSAKLGKIMELLMKMDGGSTLYCPNKGLYWLRKGSKQSVVLKTDQDLDHCKKEYGAGAESIRIACTVVNIDSAISGIFSSPQINLLSNR